MITKEIVIDKIEILEDGTIQLREKTRYLEDGVMLSEANTDRRILVPGADVSGEDAAIQTLAGIIHTPEKIAAYEAKLAESALPIEGA